MHSFSELFVIFLEWVSNGFWNFVRPFIFGSLGGWAAVFMSQVHNDSSLISLQNQLAIQFPDNDQIDKGFEKIKEQSEKFRKDVLLVHLLVGGVSGMIAVSTFNPNANNLQTFSIAVIAGVSGFAFLKRSALIDDGSTEKLLNVEKESVTKFLTPVVEISQLAQDFMTDIPDTPDSPLEQDGERSNLDQTQEAETPDAEISSNPNSEINEKFVRSLREIPSFTDEDIQYVEERISEGVPLNVIIERLRGK